MRTDRIKLLLVFSIGLTLLSGLVNYYAGRESQERVNRVLHSYKVLEHGSVLLSEITAAESNVRAYMLTWDSTFLSTYTEASNTYLQQIEKLRSLTIDNPRQTQLLDNRIKPYVSYKIEQLALVARMAKTYGIDSAVAYSYANKEKLSLDNLRGSLNDFIKYEEALLAVRLTKLDQSLLTQRIIRYTSLLLIGITLIFAYRTIAIKQKKNNDLISLLNQTNQQLEQKVKERTQELDRKNVTLTELNQQLQQSMEEIQSFYESLQLRNKKTEFMMREVNDLYNNAPCGYHSLDGDGRFVRINDTELKWIGYTREEVIDRLFLEDILTENSKYLFRRVYPEFKKKGSITDVEFDLIRKDGSILPILLSSRAIYNDDGSFLMGRTTIYDISGRKELENQLIKLNDALIKLNDEKDHFLGIAAHDLKSPINSLLGVINLLRTDSSLSPTQAHYLSIMEQSCIAMKRLVSNLLDINKIEQGQRLARDRVTARVLLETQQHFKDAAAQKGILLTFHDLTREEFFYGDQDALARVLDNLISNALKFSPKNTTVEVTASSTNSHVRFQIKDQGPGISAKDLPKLFGKFQKLSARPTDGESSSGLGLSIVKELVELMNGSVHVTTEEGNGSIFTVDLPLH